MTSNITTGSSGGGGGEELISDEIHASVARNQNYQWENYSGGGVSEIEEELSSEVSDSNNGAINPLETIREEVDRNSFSSFDFQGGGDAVYVAVSRQNEESSMDALMWALNHAVTPSSTFVFLVHIFPETKYIPTPLGKLPVGQVNPEQKENYMAQERGKRREFLHKYISVCSASQVKVDTILIESDMEAKAILDLIPILNIRKLVLGTTKSNLRRMRSKRGNGVIDQILQNAPEFCEIKIICDGKEMTELPVESPSPSLSPRAIGGPAPKFAQDQPVPNDSFACGCFKI
ncbi:Ubiquitin--protein ligase [Handroanthus impetiginosus]|uniref:Ubiquitin--protein ligase n=1 Tax=Handroanthus impetiginosus TaxID=429701 RepID=A0A2G9G7W8_9LAMI|nr:Ubiquitin--protein ligase [Handroanthus impetiginosus]